jgi:hypothetical protein
MNIPDTLEIDNDIFLSMQTKIRKLEDENFILFQKCNVYEYLLKFLLNNQSWTYLMLSYLMDDNLNNETITNINKLLIIPSELLKFVELNTNAYEQKLRSRYENNSFEFDKLRLETSFDLFKLNSELLLFYKSLPNKLAEEKKKLTNMFTNEFLIDLDALFKKHSVDLNVEQFVKSIDASKFLFSLIRDVFVRLPYNITKFDSTTISNSLDSIKQWLRENFNNFTIKIWNQSFLIEQSVYASPVERYMFKSIEDLKENYFVMKYLLDIKKTSITPYSQIVDLNCFDKFLSTLTYRGNKILNEKFGKKMNDDKLQLMQELLMFTNLCLSLPSSSTEFDNLRQNYLIENWYLKKFLLSAINTTDCNDIKNDVMNPLRLLANIKYKNKE